MDNVFSPVLVIAASVKVEIQNAAILQEELV